MRKRGRQNRVKLERQYDNPESLDPIDHQGHSGTMHNALRSSRDTKRCRRSRVRPASPSKAESSLARSAPRPERFYARQSGQGCVISLVPLPKCRQQPNQHQSGSPLQALPQVSRTRSPQRRVLKYWVALTAPLQCLVAVDGQPVADHNDAMQLLQQAKATGRQIALCAAYCRCRPLPFSA